MNQALVTSNYLLYKIANDRQPLSRRGKFNMNPAIQKNQVACTIVGCLGGLGIYIENPGFPNFVEAVQ